MNYVVFIFFLCSLLLIMDLKLMVYIFISRIFFGIKCIFLRRLVGLYVLYGICDWLLINIFNRYFDYDSIDISIIV